MSTLRGEVWSKVLTGVRYRAGGSTMEEQFAREEARASAICDAILAAVAEVLTSEAAVRKADAAYDEVYLRERMDGVRQGHNKAVRAAITAALRVAGIVEGEE